MKYTDDQIQTIILEHVIGTEQSELRYVIPFCLGYFGNVTNQIWRVIWSLYEKGFIE